MHLDCLRADFSVGDVAVFVWVKFVVVEQMRYVFAIFVRVLRKTKPFGPHGIALFESPVNRRFPRLIELAESGTELFPCK